jgi:hypothetical protein
MRKAIFTAIVLLLVVGASQRADTRDPQLALWRTIRQGLSGDDGFQFYEERLKDALVPGGANGVKALRGTVVTAEPRDHPTSITLSMDRDKPAEVTLTLIDKPLDDGPPAGTQMLFEGVVRGFSRDPFMVTIEIGEGVGFVRKAN